MSGFDTSLTSPFLAVWLLFYAGLLFWSLRHLQRVVTPSYQWLLYGLRTAGAGIILLLLLQPYFEYKKADPDSFQVAILADCSQSMSVEDGIAERSRIANLRDALRTDEEKSLVSRLSENYRTRVFVFSETLQEFRDKQIDILPGNTALGLSLQALLKQFSRTPLGAVVLLSDGHGNSGPAGTVAAQEFKARGIPITCIGIGSQRQQGDVAVAFTEQHKQAVKDEPFVLRAEVSNSLPQKVETVVQLHNDDIVLASRHVSIESGAVLPVDFSIASWQTGHQTYSVHLEQVPGDRRRDTDVDYIGVEVAEPAVFRILFLGANLNWEYKFIKLVADTTEQLSMAAVIRTGENAFYINQLTETAETEGFPQKPETFNKYDAVILDLRALPLMSEETRSALRGFVEFRGGGLLATGPLTAAGADIRGLLPVSRSVAATIQRTQHAELNEGFIFNEDPTGILAAGRGLTFEAGMEYFVIAEPKPGARVAATLPSIQRDLLLAQAYGRGRTAYLGLENSWRWRLPSETGRDVHSSFWKTLMVWLGSSGKPRFQAEVNGRKVGIGGSTPLNLTVLGTDFRPAGNAQVEANVTTPSGTVETILLNPAVTGLGQYTGAYFPRESGAYTVNYQVKTGGRTADHNAHFIARQTGLEAEDTAYREDTLRDIARISGGRFLHYSQSATLAELPLNPALPMQTRRHYWARSWWMFLLLATVLGVDWYSRRRIGLK